MMALNPNVKNYFYDVLPLDIQEHIFNINKKETLKKCFNVIYNLRFNRMKLENELKRREDNISKNYKIKDSSNWEDVEWRRSIEIVDKMVRYLKERMKRLKKYKNQIDDINEEFEEFEEEDAYFARITKKRKMSKLFDDYIKNDYIVYDYDDELLDYDEFTLFIKNL
jgi:argininosuccinate lyase